MSWGDVFWQHVRNGCDRSDAAYRADQWERRQMSKKTRRMQIGLMSLAELTAIKHRCAWKDCQATCEVNPELPTGWRWLSLWYGPPGLAPWAAGCTEVRDCVLCPTHSAELHLYVLEDIGGQLDKPKGSA